MRQCLNRGAASKQEVDAVAHLLDRALARKPETLDLSSAALHLLERLSASLLMRLDSTRTLVLAQDCPPPVALRLMHEIGARHLEPKSLMTAVENALSVARAPAPRPPRPKTPAAASRSSLPTAEAAIYDTPPRRREKACNGARRPACGIYDTPGSLFRSTDDASGPVYANLPPPIDSARRQRALLDAMPSPILPVIHEAERAMRTLTAWSRTRASQEGPHPRCAMSSSDADAIAHALRQASPSELKAPEWHSWTSATAALAARAPNVGFQVGPETIGHMEVALDAVRMLAAEGVAPPLPPRRAPTRDV